MALVLSDVEIRVLGSLIEKQIATPDYYPMTINALMNACNQKSSRDPVVSYEENTVQRALDSLREKKLVWMFKGADSRVMKYGHIFPDAFELNDRAVAAICVLLLRGPQTPGEIRGRARSLYNFETVEEVDETLQKLIDNEIQSLAIKLPRQPGFKEFRYAHLLAGPIDLTQFETAQDVVFSPSREPSTGEKLSRLQEEVQSLRQELDQLRQEFAEFKRQFE